MTTPRTFDAALIEFDAINASLTDWICEADFDADPATAHALRNLANDLIADSAALLDCYANGFGTVAIANRVRRVVEAAHETAAFATEIIDSRPARLSAYRSA
jgi:hypothetical protein